MIGMIRIIIKRALLLPITLPVPQDLLLKMSGVCVAALGYSEKVIVLLLIATAMSHLSEVKVMASGLSGTNKTFYFNGN